MPKLISGPAGARFPIENIGASKIREVANAGMNKNNVTALWYGEPDLPTPAFICEAATRSMGRGETFYTPNLGVQELRYTLSSYQSSLHQKQISHNRIAVTASGMSATNLVQQILTDPGDNIIVSAPVWPNLIETVRIMGGEPRLAWLEFLQTGWHLDLEKLFSYVDDRTRAILINSPSNPTGWVMSKEEQLAVLEFCRQRGIWYLSDEVYDRMFYSDKVAPSILTIAEDDDRVVVINSFSKSWCMTGWRLGWLTVPINLIPTLEKIIEFHYSCPAHFSQVAGITAIRDGEPFISSLMTRYTAARDLVIERLHTMPRVKVHRPEGAFYAFFHVDGITDSLEFCKTVLDKTNVGLAPGSAFGEKGEGYIRLCYASTLDRLAIALDKLQPMLS